jgi:dihydrolipoamide dehydrogenase
MVVGDVTTAVNTIIVGGGPGGYVAAIRAKQLGLNPTLVNAGDLGGVCLNSGCIPLKALITASRRFRQIGDESNAAMGIGTSAPTLDWTALQSWKRSVVQRLTGGVAGLLRGHKIEVINGLGWFMSAKELRVEGEYGSHRFAFEKCLIATGASPAPLPDLPFSENVISPQDALSLPQLPDVLTIIGDDYIALELATLFQNFGAKVTLLAQGKTLLPEVDPAALRLVLFGLRKLGLNIVTGASDFKLADGKLSYTAEGKAGESAAPVVVCNGVRPNLAKLNLSAAGLKADNFTVSPSLHTSVPYILAAGDVTGGLAMASVAIKQAKVAAESLVGRKVAFVPQVIPQIIHTTPEVAWVGFTATAAKEAGYEVAVGRFPLGANGRALTLGADAGVCLTVADAESGALLGMTIVGPQAGDLIMQAALAIEMGATLTDLSEILYPHPALPELALESVEHALGLAIHAL